ncbi:hypothetical protein [Enterococcus sp. BWR-S5]|uniref:hypothetical protein n=1 Tax=Enterococcus sp. BWR-S5 TaxID=2787714 RepID=UPI00192218C4|nr:hypothetical protein [Enterococcus sp. BWR-S5]MBL1227244.1 hypothetical protein [Enterococcus sp. BWR-S5]
MYSWDGMIKISKEKALTLFKSGETVFCLYDDQTEGAVQEVQDIHNHDECEGFGIEK